MTSDTLWLSAVIVAALLALANVWRGTMLIKAGENRRGSKFMMLGAAMMMLTTAALLLKQI